MNPLLSATLCSALLSTVASAAPAVGVGAGTAVTAAPLPEVLPFIENDYPRALKEAQARGLPLFVDAWAPW